MHVAQVMGQSVWAYMAGANDNRGTHHQSPYKGTKQCYQSGVTLKQGQVHTDVVRNVPCDEDRPLQAECAGHSGKIASVECSVLALSTSHNPTSAMAAQIIAYL